RSTTPSPVSLTLCTKHPPPTRNPLTSPPRRSSDLVTTDEDPAATVDFSSHVSDVETANANLTYNIVSGPSHGSMSGSGGSQTYTAHLNFHLTSTISHSANDVFDPHKCSSAPCSSAL